MGAKDFVLPMAIIGQQYLRCPVVIIDWDPLHAWTGAEQEGLSIISSSSLTFQSLLHHCRCFWKIYI